MAKEETKKEVSRTSVKRKSWYKILSPKLFGQKELGESYLASAESALGRMLKVNLKELTGNVKDQSTYISFIINKVDGGALRTVATGCQTTSTSVKRMVRKNTDRLDDNFVFKTKDGKEVILKSLMITQFKAQRSVQKQLRQELKAVLAEEISQSDLPTFIGNIINRKVIMGAKKRLQKIFPVREICIRVLTLAGDKSKEEDVVVTEEKPAAVEEKPAEAKEIPAGKRKVKKTAAEEGSEIEPDAKEENQPAEKAE